MGSFLRPENLMFEKHIRAKFFPGTGFAGKLSTD
jgi:hypothetical protein